VLETAHEVGQGCLPAFSHRFSPKTFTQPQLFACLILKAFFQTDYRGIEGILCDLPELGAAIGMTRVPHFTTLQKAESRLLNKATTRKLLQETIKAALTPTQMKRIVELAAMDGSGFDSRHISNYFVRRRNSKNDDFWQETLYSRFPKLALVCDCSNHMTLALDTTRGPSPDIRHFFRLLRQAASDFSIKNLVADAGYDSERSHEFAITQCHVRSIIPPKIGRPTKSLPTGHFRRKLAKRFPRKLYSQRWQIETVFSMLKRRLRSALTARRFHSQCRELNLKVLALNIMILYFIA
jgi:Transposase DDE domain